MRQQGVFWYYTFSAQTDSGWQALCGLDGGVPIEALTLRGTWNYQSGVPGGGSWSDSSTLFTIACRHAKVKMSNYPKKPPLPHATPRGGAQ